MDIKTAVTKCLFLNELSGNMNAAYRFSNAGGKSGYSFGATQLDVSNNPQAVCCLTECGFTRQDIARLRAMDKHVEDLSSKLTEHKDIIGKYDAQQVQECIDHVQRVSGLAKIRYADLEAFCAACDYHNQFYMSASGQFTSHFRGNQTITADVIKAFKLSQKWGKEHPSDVERRAANIKKVVDKCE